MTKTEQAELESLNMTPEQLEERRLKLAAMGITSPNNPIELNSEGPARLLESARIAGGITVPQQRKRKPRSDNGVPKPKKPTAVDSVPTGVITKDQRNQLEALRSAMDSASVDAENANTAACKAATRYFDYLDSITVGGGK